jgi:hypothetical protein
MANAPDYLLLFVFVLVSYGVLHLARMGIGQWLRWDTGQKERAMQDKLAEVQRELDKAKERVIILEKQIELLLGQYNEAVIKLNQIKTRYEEAEEDARRLREELVRMNSNLPDMEMRSNRLLIAAVGAPNSQLNLDLASLRAVKMNTGLAFERISEATPERLQQALDMARGMRAITYLHLSTNADREGYQLMDTIVDANWLSENLQGVTILVVAGSESTDVGEFLGIVPYVITMNDKLPSRDAARFTRHFWTEIGNGIGPSLAFQRALDQSPGRMSEYVKKHWNS